MAARGGPASGKEMLRDAYRDEIARAGEARKSALEQADAELKRIAGLLPGATNAGISVTEIARLADVSRPTIYELLKGSGAEPDNLAIVLAALLDGPRTEAELTETLALDDPDLEHLLGALIEQGWVDRLAPDGESSGGFMASDDGEKAMADWEFPEEVGDRTTKTLRVALDLMRFSAEDRKIINRKVAQARAQGKERLGLIEAVRMGIEAERQRKPRPAKDVGK